MPRKINYMAQIAPCFLMPKVNLRELRDTRQLKAWLRSGETVELFERNHRLGSIVPDSAPAERAERPDFAGRAEKLFGDRRLPGAELLIRERGRS